MYMYGNSTIVLIHTWLYVVHAPFCLVRCSLQAVSLDADIPLALVLHLASHLVHWGKAMAIYPLSENNSYITSPTADTGV